MITSVLAIDQALTHFGYSVWDNTGAVVYDNVVFTINKEDTLQTKLKAIYTCTDELISKFNPQAIVCEQLWHGINIDTFKKLSMVNALLLVLSWKHNIEYKEINIRKYRNFFGITDKTKVKEYVEQNYPDIKIDKKMDISDAFLLGKYIYKNEFNLEKC